MSRVSVGATVGDLIADRYRLAEQIGEGGMGRVFRATDETLGRDVAVKILLPQYAAQETSRQRFTREAKVTATLSHPSAIRIYDFGSEREGLFLVMELLTGLTLRRAITERLQLPPEEAIAIAAHVADVLVSAHELPLIHRDLKPENIMLDTIESATEVKVLDFGMAFIADNEDATAKGMGRLTRDGLAGGTPTYMSPEQVQGVAVSGASDVYALGCVLFEMLAGVPPFEGPMMKVLTKQMYQPAPDVRRFCQAAPQALVELVARMLGKKPGERPSAETVRTRLLAMGPAAGGERERSRDAEFLSTREARMISAPVLPRPDPDVPEATLTTRLVGELDDEIMLALAASGITISAADAKNINEDAGKNVDVVLVVDRTQVESLAELQTLCLAPIPVVVASTSVAIDAVSDLLRAGVTEIVTLPLASDELAKKLRRAVRKKR